MIAPSIPVLTAVHPTLRAARPSDFDAFAALYATARSAGMGGPLDRLGAWHDTRASAEFSAAGAEEVLVYRHLPLSRIGLEGTA